MANLNHDWLVLSGKCRRNCFQISDIIGWLTTPSQSVGLVYLYIQARTSALLLLLCARVDFKKGCEVCLPGVKNHGSFHLPDTRYQISQQLGGNAPRRV